MTHELAEAPHNFAGAEYLTRGRLEHALERVGRRAAGHRVNDHSGTFRVIRDGGQRLVQLVRKGSRQRGNLANTPDVGKLGLKILEPKLGLLAFGEVPDETVKILRSPSRASPMRSSIGKVVPSRCRALVKRPIPMIFRAQRDWRPLAEWSEGPITRSANLVGASLNLE